jgi:putative C-S lyase
MNYDFTSIIPRNQMGAIKWDSMSKQSVMDQVNVPLSVADMEFKTCSNIITAIKKAADFGVFGYTYLPPTYTTSVVDWMEKRHGWSIQPEWIEQTWGVVMALYHAIRAYSQEGDEVIIQTPVYYPFFSAVKDTGRVLVESPLQIVQGRYEMDFEDLKEKAKTARLMILCSPHNPVGRVWTEEELRTLGDICLANDVLLISDEIHSDLIHGTHKHTVYAKLGEAYAENSIVCTSPNKTFNLAGMPMSNIIISNPDLRKKFQDASRMAGTEFYGYFGYAACEAGYTLGEKWLEEMLSVVWHNYQVFKSFMAEHFPEVIVHDMQGTYLAWFDCSSFGLGNRQLELFLKEEASLYLNQGYVFGKTGSQFLRINLACPTSVIENALDRLYAAAKRCEII